MTTRPAARKSGAHKHPHRVVLVSRAIQGHLPGQIEELDAAILRICPDHARVGGNHLLEGLNETGLYQRHWPRYKGD